MRIPPGWISAGLWKAPGTRTAGAGVADRRTRPELAGELLISSPTRGGATCGPRGLTDPEARRGGGRRRYRGTGPFCLGASRALAYLHQHLDVHEGLREHGEAGAQQHLRGRVRHGAAGPGPAPSRHRSRFRARGLSRQPLRSARLAGGGSGLPVAAGVTSGAARGRGLSGASLVPCALGPSPGPGPSAHPCMPQTQGTFKAEALSCCLVPTPVRGLHVPSLQP